MYWYALAALFVLSQLVWFLLGKVVCKVRYSIDRHMICSRCFSLSAWVCAWNLEVEVDVDVVKV